MDRTTRELVGVMLADGPYGGHYSVYELFWPPPQQLIGFCHPINGKIAVTADMERLVDARACDPSAKVYNKITQSDLPAGTGNLVRGAVYVVKEEVWDRTTRCQTGRSTGLVARVRSRSAGHRAKHGA